MTIVEAPVLDSKIVGGLVVDGTGAEPYRADVGVKDGQIVEVAPAAGIDTEAAETIDATGRIVTPGFVDIHTHYDGQVTWDPLLEPSSVHGVTTVVSGNCGVGFAPVRPGTEDWLIELMEGVEDIPGTALTEGMTWGWESFPEYLDAVGQRELAVDFGVQVAHGSVRAYAMGERGARNEPATPEDIEAMARDRAGGDRGRRARLLDLAHARPPGDGRRAGARHVRRRGRALRARPGDGPRRAGRLRAGPGRLGRRGPGGARARAGVDGAARRPRSTGRCRSR